MQIVRLISHALSVSGDPHRAMTCLVEFRASSWHRRVPLVGLLEVPLRVLSSLAGALRAGSPLLDGLQPVGVGLGVLAFLAMTTTIGYVVGRDFLPVLRPSTRGGIGSGQAD